MAFENFKKNILTLDYGPYPRLCLKLEIYRVGDWAIGKERRSEH